MPRVSFLIFVMFNHYYRSGNHRKDIAPHSTTIIALMFYEAFLLMIIDGLIKKFTGFSLLESISFDRTNLLIGRLNATIIFLLLYPANHWYFVKNKGFDKLYDQYHKSELNTKKNRVICAVLWTLGLIGLLVLVITTPFY